MADKIAFASSDGKQVDQHFGRARNFIIYEIQENGVSYLENRENNPPCQEFQHSEKAIYKSVDLISDCKAIFVTKIGYGALSALHSKDIKVYEAPYYIADIIEKLLTSAPEIIG